MHGRLVTLFSGNFVVGTGTLAVPGMLLRLAEAFAVSVPTAGRLVAAFALTICLTAPALAVRTSRCERRTLLVVTMAVFTLGHLGAALAPGYEVLLGTRLVSALSAGLFTAQAAGVAGLLVPPQRRGSAIAIVFLGWSIAAVLGLPTANQVSAALGFRAVFGLVAAGGILSVGLLATLLPPGLFVAPIGREAWSRLRLSGPVVVTVPVTFLQAPSTAGNRCGSWAWRRPSRRWGTRSTPSAWTRRQAAGAKTRGQVIELASVTALPRVSVPLLALALLLALTASRRPVPTPA